MQLFDPAHPFFAPLWRRIAVTALCLGWAGVEFVTGGLFWAFAFGAIGLYCGYQFFIAFPGNSETDTPKDGQDK